MGIGGISVVQILIILVLLVITTWPSWRILDKVGFSRWWTIVVFVPILNLVMFWVLAFVKWPAVDRETYKELQSHKIIVALLFWR